MISQKEKATSLFNQIIHLEHQKIDIQLVGKLQQSSDKNFHALYYNVRPIQEHAPSWWPNNAHISFAYRYDVPFSKIEMETIEQSIAVYTGTLMEFRVMKCSGCKIIVLKYVRVNQIRNSPESHSDSHSPTSPQRPNTITLLFLCISGSARPAGSLA